MEIERIRVRAVFHWRPWCEDYELTIAYRDEHTGKRYYAKSIEWVELSVGELACPDETLLVSHDDAKRLIDSFSGTPALDRGQMPEVVKAKDEHIADLREQLVQAHVRTTQSHVVEMRQVGVTAEPVPDRSHTGGSAHE